MLQTVKRPLCTVLALLIIAVASVQVTALCARAGEVGADAVMTLDPGERYTGGEAYTEQEISERQNSTSKALFVGIIVVLLIITVIFISYKSRMGDDTEQDAPVPPPDSGEKDDKR